jgi:hypothetical protein
LSWAEISTPATVDEAEARIAATVKFWKAARPLVARSIIRGAPCWNVRP